MSTINVPTSVPMQYRSAVANASAKWNVPAEYIAAVIDAETGGTWNPNLTSSDGLGSYGLGQFLPGTAQSLGVNTHDTNSTIDGVGHLLHDNYAATGNWDDAIAAYNTGLGGIVKGKPDSAGQRYLSAVKGYLGGSSTATLADTANVTLASDVTTQPSGLLSSAAGALFKPVINVLLDAGMIAAGIAAFLFGGFLMFKEMS